MAETAPRQSHVNLWELRMDARMGQAQGQPQRIANFSGSDIRCLSATHDGKRLAFLQGPFQADVYVGELEQEGSSLMNPRRLTLDERDHLPLHGHSTAAQSYFTPIEMASGKSSSKV